MSDPSPWSREGSTAYPEVIVVPEPGAFTPVPQHPEPPPVRRRGRWIAVAAVAFVVLVVAGGALGLALSSVAKDGAARHTGPATLTAPETIGPFTKQNQAPTDLMTEATRAEHPFAAMYLDDQGHPVLVWGGTDERYRSGDGAARIDEILSGFAGLGLDPSARVDVDPGPSGGLAQCAPLRGSGFTGAVCGWTGSGALLAFMFGGTELSAAKTTLPTMLSAIVTF